MAQFNSDGFISNRVVGFEVGLLTIYYERYVRLSLLYVTIIHRNSKDKDLALGM